MRGTPALLCPGQLHSLTHPGVRGLQPHGVTQWAWRGGVGAGQQGLGGSPESQPRTQQLIHGVRSERPLKTPRSPRFLPGKPQMRAVQGSLDSELPPPSGWGSPCRKDLGSGTVGAPPVQPRCVSLVPLQGVWEGGQRRGGGWGGWFTSWRAGPLRSPGALLRRDVFTLEGPRRAPLGRGGAPSVTQVHAVQCPERGHSHRATCAQFGGYVASCGRGLETKMVGCQLRGAGRGWAEPSFSEVWPSKVFLLRYPHSRSFTKTCL